MRGVAGVRMDGDMGMAWSTEIPSKLSILLLPLLLLHNRRHFFFPD